MIISRTPFRLSFFGGGSDYPDWYEKHSGCFLSMAIDKYCYITCRNLPPFFEHKHRVVYSIVENVNELEQIQHPVVRETLKWKKLEQGLEIHHDGDLPARSGLGSSSAFSVGLINAICSLEGKKVSKRFLSDYAIHLEQNILKENVGSQDQIAVAFGGFTFLGTTPVCKKIHCTMPVH